MRPTHHVLPRHLLIILLVKLGVLLALWWGFVHEKAAQLDAKAVAAHIERASPAAVPPPQRQGEPQ